MRAKAGRFLTISTICFFGALFAFQSAWAAVPTITSEWPPPNPVEDEIYSYEITAQDPDGGTTFQITIANKPDFLNFDQNKPSSARLYSPSGSPPTHQNLGQIYEVTITVKDAQNEVTKQVFTMQVEPMNDDPIITEGDIDADTATQDQPYSHVFTVWDEENDAVTVNIEASIIPSWLSVTKISQSPQKFEIKGTPDNAIALSGDQSINIQLEDGNGGVVFLWYNLAVANVNDAPTISDGVSPPVQATQDVEYTHTFQVTDIDGDVVTVNQEDSTIPDWLTVVKTADDPQTFQISGTPDNAVALQPQPQDVIIRLEDGNNGVVLLDYDLTVINVNDAPVITSGQAPLTNAKQDIEYNHTFTVSDIDGNNVTVKKAESVIPSWLDVTKISQSPQTFEIKGTPTNAVALQVQPINVDIRLGDNFDDVSEKFINLTFSITVENVNDKPTIVSGALAPVTATQGVVYTHSFTVSDIDGDTVVFKPDESVLPSWLSLTKETGETQKFTITSVNEEGVAEGPPNSAALTGNPHHVYIKIGDGVLGNEKFAILDYNLTVQNVNDAPVIIQGATPPASITQGVQYSHVVAIEDIDNDIVTFDMEGSNKPAWMTVVNIGTNKFELKGTPTNADVIAATDATGTPIATTVDLRFGDNFETNEKFVSLTWNLTLNNANDRPTISGSPIAVRAGAYTTAEPYIFRPAVNDVDKFGDKASWDIFNLEYGIVNQPPTAWSRFETIETDDGRFGVLKLFPSETNVSQTTTWNDIQIIVSDGNPNGDALLTFSLTVVSGDDQILKGDFNLDFTVDLTDAVMGLQVLAGIAPAQRIYLQPGTDVDDNGKLNLADVIYVLRELSAVQATQ